MAFILIYDQKEDRYLRYEKSLVNYWLGHRWKEGWLVTLDISIALPKLCHVIV